VGTDWQRLGELELPPGSDAEQTIYVWLTKSLKPLALPENFVNKVSESAQGAVVRITAVKSIMKFEHIYLVLFVPPEQDLKEQSWGFFRVEKILDPAEGALMQGPLIEFYLYREGE
jgi:hypothetical protein